MYSTLCMCLYISCCCCCNRNHSRLNSIDDDWLIEWNNNFSPLTNKNLISIYTHRCGLIYIVILTHGTIGYSEFFVDIAEPFLRSTVREDNEVYILWNLKMLSNNIWQEKTHAIYFDRLFVEYSMMFYFFYFYFQRVTHCANFIGADQKFRIDYHSTDFAEVVCGMLNGV